MSNAINVAPAPEMSTSQTGVEEWRDITDPRVVPGRYQVSSFGRVRDLKRDIVFLQHTDRDGYLHISLARADGTIGGYSVHRLVAFAFLAAPEDPSYVIDHIDGNPQNNNADNLQWCSQMENINNPISLQRKKDAAQKRGPHKIRPVICVDTKQPFESVAKAAKAFGISPTSVAKSCKLDGLPVAGTVTTISGHTVYHFKYLEDWESGKVQQLRPIAHRNQPVRCTDEPEFEGDKRLFATVQEAADYFGITSSAVLRSCRRAAEGKPQRAQRKDWVVHHFEWYKPEEPKAD